MYGFLCVQCNSQGQVLDPPCLHPSAPQIQTRCIFLKGKVSQDKLHIGFLLRHRLTYSRIYSNWSLSGESVAGQKPNSWMYNFVEDSGHNLTWSFGIKCLHYKPVSNLDRVPGITLQSAPSQASPIVKLSFCIQVSHPSSHLMICVMCIRENV